MSKYDLSPWNGRLTPSVIRAELKWQPLQLPYRALASRVAQLFYKHFCLLWVCFLNKHVCILLVSACCADVVKQCILLPSPSLTLSYSFSLFLFVCLGMHRNHTFILSNWRVCCAWRGYCKKLIDIHSTRPWFWLCWCSPLRWRRTGSPASGMSSLWRSTSGFRTATLVSSKKSRSTYAAAKAAAARNVNCGCGAPAAPPCSPFHTHTKHTHTHTR